VSFQTRQYFSIEDNSYRFAGIASLPDSPGTPSPAFALFNKNENGPGNLAKKTKEATMRVDEYRRLHSMCIDMAKQPSVPDVRARWLAMAAQCMKLATQAAERERSTRR
jgi:hypothetical protein